MANEVLNPTEDELNDEAVKQFYEAFYSCYEEVKSPYGDFLFKELQTGIKTLFNKSIKETKRFDHSFVEVLKTAYPSLFKISDLIMLSKLLHRTSAIGEPVT